MDKNIIIRAEHIINSKDITSLSEADKKVLADYRKHLIERIQYFRKLLVKCYDKESQCEKLTIK